MPLIMSSYLSPSSSSSSATEPEVLTLNNVEIILQRDTKIKLGGVDVDGIIRGKIISKKKFMSVVKDGFGFCSVVFGWDMHDQTYFRELKISNAENGYKDLIARIDLSTFRRVPWEGNIPFFLVSFYDPDTGNSVSACPRSLLRRVVSKVEKAGYSAMAGAEYEFFTFRTPHNPAAPKQHQALQFLQKSAVHDLPTLTEGMYG